MICLAGCAGSAAMVGWILPLLLWLVVRTLTPRSAAQFDGEDADPMLLGDETYLSFGLAIFITASKQTRQDKINDPKVGL